MSRYRISFSARREVHGIIDYVRAERPQAAANLQRDLLAAFRRLANQPGIGHAREDFAHRSDLRFWRVRSYLIVYRRLPEEGVEIARVLHGSRDIAALLETIRRAKNRPLAGGVGGR